MKYNCTYLPSETNRQNETRTEQTEESDIAIPLLLQNKVPEGFETDDKLDVSLRPEEVSNVLLLGTSGVVIAACRLATFSHRTKNTFCVFVNFQFVDLKFSL